MRFEIHLDGQKKLLDTTRALDRELIKGIRTAVQTSARDLRTKARSFAPKHSGNLRSAIKYRSFARFLSATVYVDAKIAPHRHLVLRGRTPGKIPPSGPGTPLAAWAAAHGLNPKAVARDIAARGTRPSLPFMRMAFDTLRPAIVARMRAVFEYVFARGGR